MDQATPSSSSGKKTSIADSVAVLALRIIFIVVAGGVGTIWSQSRDFDGYGGLTPFLVFSGVLIVAFGIVGIDISTKVSCCY